MLVNTKAIVLHSFKYSDNSLIIHVYTEKMGRLSLLLNSIRNKKTGSKIALFQPLSILNVIIYKKNNGGIQKIKEVENAVPFTSIPFEIKKNTVALFLGEVLYKCLKEEEENSQLFQFLENSILYFDLVGENYTDFHLIFLLNFLRFLGTRPENNFNSENQFFDLKAGKFKPTPPTHTHFLEPTISFYLHKLLLASVGTSAPSFFSKSARNHLLNSILEYYYFHLEGVKEMKSPEILQIIFE